MKKLRCVLVATDRSARNPRVKLRTGSERHRHTTTARPDTHQFSSTEGGRATGVMTPRGEIRAPVVVDAAGGWTARGAAGAGITLPLIPVRHQLFITEAIPGVAPLQPIVRLVEASVYVRYEQGGLMFGGYEDAPRVLGREGLAPGASLDSAACGIPGY